MLENWHCETDGIIEPSHYNFFVGKKTQSKISLVIHIYRDIIYGNANYSNLPWLIMTFKNLMMTFEHGLMRTWRLPRFSALFIDLRASLNTFMRTILTLYSRHLKNWNINFAFDKRHRGPRSRLNATVGYRRHPPQTRSGKTSTIVDRKLEVSKSGHVRRRIVGLPTDYRRTPVDGRKRSVCDYGNS